MTCTAAGEAEFLQAVFDRLRDVNGKGCLCGSMM